MYKVKGQYKEALGALEQFKLLSDSLIALDQRVAITKKDLEFEAQQQELEAEAVLAKQTLRNQSYLTIGGGLLLVIILVSVLLSQKRKATAKAREAEFQKNLAESKLVALRTQLNPHFIFNALNSIDQYMVSHGTQEASNYLVKFSTLMRKILENSGESWITLAEEMDLMKLYVDIERLRLSNTISLNVEIDKDIDLQNTLVPSMFIQPFIENSIEHGISKKDGPGKITIGIKAQANETLTCTIEDDGVGRQAKSAKEDHQSMGMQLAQNRVDYLNQLTQDNASFAVEDLSPGFRVTISIPHKTRF